MKKLNLAIVILLALVLALIPLLGACGGGTPGEQEEEEEEEELYGGVLKMISGIATTNIGYPVDMHGGGDIYSRACLETLVNIDENGDLAPNLATDWDISPDFESITLTLREDVKFHDGTDFNAEAVKYNLDLWINSPNPELNAVTSIDVVDDHTVRLNLSRVDTILLNALAFQAGYMVSPTAIETHGKNWAMLNAVGTGPFKFLSWERDVYMRFEKFDDYWQEGKPYLDGIEFIFITDATVAVMAFQAGDAQVIMLRGPQDAHALQGSAEFEIQSSPQMIVAFSGDSGNPDSPFADVRVRQAVEYAIDKQAICGAVSYDYFQPANQPAAPGDEAYNPNVVGYPYNPEKARELLAEAAAEGAFEPNDLGGFDTKLIIPAGFTEITDAFTAIQAYLADVGIDASIEQAGYAIFITYAEDGWENGLIFRVHGVGPAVNIASNFQQVLSSNGTQYVSVAFPTDYEAKLDEAIEEVDPVERKALKQELVKMVVDDYCLVSCVYIAPYLLAKYPEVHDLMTGIPHITQWVPTNTWLSGEKPGWDGDYEPPPPPVELDWSDMPIYAGAEQTEQGTWQLPSTAPMGWTQEELRFYATEDSSSDVASFYQSAMLDNGWEEIMVLENMLNMDYILLYNKNSEQDGAEVLIDTHEGKTYICLKRQAK